MKTSMEEHWDREQDRAAYRQSILDRDSRGRSLVEERPIWDPRADQPAAPSTQQEISFPLTGFLPSRRNPPPSLADANLQALAAASEAAVTGLLRRYAPSAGPKPPSPITKKLTAPQENSPFAVKQVEDLKGVRTLGSANVTVTKAKDKPKPKPKPKGKPKGPAPAVVFKAPS